MISDDFKQAVGETLDLFSRLGRQESNLETLPDKFKPGGRVYQALFTMLFGGDEAQRGDRKSRVSRP